MERLYISKNVKDKIRKELDKYDGIEFGGWLIAERNVIKDVIFDVKFSNEGFVEFDFSNILKQPKDVQKKVCGWFHKHPINGLSGMDIDTMNQLTSFWGRCYTLVLQANGKLLLLRTQIPKEYEL